MVKRLNNILYSRQYRKFTSRRVKFYVGTFIKIFCKGVKNDSSKNNILWGRGNPLITPRELAAEMPLKMLVGRQDCLHKMLAISRSRQDCLPFMSTTLPAYSHSNLGNPACPTNILCRHFRRQFASSAPLSQAMPPYLFGGEVVHSAGDLMAESDQIPQLEAGFRGALGRLPTVGLEVIVAGVAAPPPSPLPPTPQTRVPAPSRRPAPRRARIHTRCSPFTPTMPRNNIVFAKKNEKIR